MKRWFSRGVAAVTESQQGGRRQRSLRTRILVVAWGPSLVLLLIGGIVAGILVVDSLRVKSVADIFYAPEEAEPFLPAVQTEMRLSAAELVNSGQASESALAEQRDRTDAALIGFQAITSRIDPDSTTADYRRMAAELQTVLGKLPGIREDVDNGSISLEESTAYYGSVIRSIGRAVNQLAGAGPDGESAVAAGLTDTFWEESNSLAEANALAYAAFSKPGLTDGQYQAFLRAIGRYRENLAEMAPYLAPAAGDAYTALTGTPAWRQQQQIEQAVIAAGPGVQAELTIDRTTWGENADQIYAAFAAIGLDQVFHGGSLARGIASERITEAVVGGVLLLLLAIAVLLLTTRESNRLVSRLRKLRLTTLDLAQVRLPHMIERLREGEKVDTDDELARLDFGNDEIGEVAEAFEYAQSVAVSAAVQEAETRAGLRLVFLNIARRSQVIVHQQLSVLEQAERYQEDPEQLKLLFELDHLSTRARRNAENLVIMGDGQPGRQWRNAVPLSQVVRGAISEAQDYARVAVTELPRLSITGAAVADVVHLLAEIVDNATSFSPPMSRVEVRGNLVGRGLAIEIEDQGLGIPPQQLQQLNEMMTRPPEFHVMALREEPRLGMFVVGQLARKNGIRVTLTPSPAYGGTRVVVLLPNELLDTKAEAGPNPLEDAPVTDRSMNSIHERMAFHGELAPAGGTGRSRLTVVGSSGPSGNGVGTPPEADGVRRTGRPQAVNPRPAQPEPAHPEPAQPEPALSEVVRPPVFPARTAGGHPNGNTGPNPYFDHRDPQDRESVGHQPEGRRTGRDTAPTPVVTAAPMPRVPQAAHPPRRETPRENVRETARDTTRNGAHAGRPDLPRRTRQAHLSDRLREPAAAPPVPTATGAHPTVAPERARSTMVAFQSGTRRGRGGQPGFGDETG